jgi:hypothetical protein
MVEFIITGSRIRIRYPKSGTYSDLKVSDQNKTLKKSLLKPEK